MDVSSLQPPHKTEPPPPPSGSLRFLGTGKRKSATARVILSLGTGQVRINGRLLEEYFGLESLRLQALSPLVLTQTQGRLDVRVNVKGGGLSGQSQAIRHGISKALLEFNPDLRPRVKKEGLLVRDARKKERKKYGRRGARRGFQWTKR